MTIALLEAGDAVLLKDRVPTGQLRIHPTITNRTYRVIGRRRKTDGAVEYKLMGWASEQWWEPARNVVQSSGVCGSVV